MPLVDLVSCCVGFWKMNDNLATSVVLDSSGNGNDGTYKDNTGDINTENGSIAGVIDKALTFVKGNRTRIQVPHDTSLNLGTGDFSIALWFQSSDLGLDEGRAIICKETAAKQKLFFLDYLGEFTLSIIDTDANVGNMGAFFSYTDDDVHHVVCVCKRGIGTLMYLDGSVMTVEFDTTATVTGSLDSTEDLFIGYEPNHPTSYPHDGLMDVLSIFNRALTAEEVAFLYNSGNGTEELAEHIEGCWMY